jgi:uncharacterized protein YndB with AHSA1/START domain
LDDPRVPPIVHSVEIARSPKDVFDYLDDLERHSEWNPDIVSSKRETNGPTRVGSRATDLRRGWGGTMSITYEITEHDPPRKSTFRGVNGPVRAVGTFTAESIGDGGSRVTIELDFQGQGPVGAVFVPLVRRQARTHVPVALQGLKECLESEPRPPTA